VTLKNPMNDAQRTSFAKRMQAFVDGKVSAPTVASRSTRNAQPAYDPDAGVR
jgi:hypothetical protein